MRILWIDPIGSDAFREVTLGVLNAAKRPETRVDFVSLPPDRPRHLEDPVSEAAVVPDVVRIVAESGGRYDGILIGCFFDTGLAEARAVAGDTIVTGPCEAVCEAALRIGRPYTILAGHPSWEDRIRDNVARSRGARALASIRSLGLGVYDLADHAVASRAALAREGRRALDEDGARCLVIGCTADTSSAAALQEELGVPVLDAVVAPFQETEARIARARPSRGL